MRRLVESTFITLDGVISEPQRWSPPYWDEEHAAYSTSLLEPADALLLGRKTYEGFAQAWPERSGDPFTDKMNSMPKYVASRTLTEATWNSQVIADVPTDVAALKEQEGGTLLKFGTGSLSQTLLEGGLLDELHLWMFPTIAGTGEQLLSDMLEITHLSLQDVTRFRSGIVVLTYVPK